MFLFTDAGAKDQNLKNTVIALIERTQTVVSSQTLVCTIVSSSVLLLSSTLGVSLCR